MSNMMVKIKMLLASFKVRWVVCVKPTRKKVGDFEKIFVRYTELHFFFHVPKTFKYQNLKLVSKVKKTLNTVRRGIEFFY